MNPAGEGLRFARPPPATPPIAPYGALLREEI